MDIVSSVFFMTVLCYNKPEGTQKVRTHAVLLLTLTLTCQPKVVPLYRICQGHEV